MSSTRRPASRASRTRACGPPAAATTWRRRRARPTPPGSVSAVTTLAERLGYDHDARLLIINCDDLGSSHAANVGVYESLRSGLATSATLMVPCPWSRAAAAA